MKNGYRFTELRLRGANVSDAFVKFEKGLNIIQGPSETGKTYIFQCINYLLGSSKPPKKIDEAKLYSEAFLELKTKSNVKFSIQSDLKGGDLKVYKSSIEDLKFDNNYELLSRKHNPQNDGTISAFLLKLNNIYGKKIRTNAQGKIRDISYRDIVRFCMIDEYRIFTEDSIVFSNYIKKTEDSNVLKYIISGIDDSSIITKLSKSQITNKRGKLEMLTELIDDLNSDILKLSKNPSDNLDEIIEQIKVLTTKHGVLHDEYLSLSSQRQETLSSFDKISSEKRVLEELVDRTEVLDLHYTADIKRLNSTVEASFLLKDNPITQSACPLCNSKIDHKCDEIEISQIIDSCSAEIKKIEKLKIELQATLKLLNKEVRDLNKEANILKGEIEKLSNELDKSIGDEIKKLADAISILNSKKSHFLGINMKHNQLEKLINQKTTITNLLEKAKTKGNYDSLSTAYLTDVSNQVEKILKSIKYPDLSAVSYSEENFDLVISGKNRNVFGKGYRAILYSTFVIAIHELMTKLKYSLGVPIIDSPLVTYKETEIDSDGISINLAMNFYRHLAKKSEIDQIIIIENDPPPDDIIDKIHFIKFTKLHNNGRYGFVEINPTANNL